MIDAILSWFAFAAFFAGAFMVLHRAEFRWFQGPVIKRADSPGQYWFWTSIFLAATCFCFLAALCYTFAR